MNDYRQKQERRVLVIDSVTLAFKESQYQLADDRYFVGKSMKQINGRFCISKIFTDMAIQSKKQGKYFPQVEVPKSKTGKDKIESSCLLIQVSIPKLLYGTNLFEVDEVDYLPFCKKLSEELWRIKVVITPDNVANAIIKRADLCKSVILPPYFGTARQVIYKLQKFNYKPDSDFTVKEFRDGSREIFLKYYNTTQGYVVYDKAAEIIANGYTDIETRLIKHLKDGKLIRRVLRFELSLQKKQSMDAVLRRHIPEKGKDFTLKDLFSNKQALRNILLETFDKIYSPAHILLVTLSEMRENEIENYLDSLNISSSEKYALSYFANKATKYGPKGTLAEMKETMSPSNYGRHKKKLTDISSFMDTIGLEQPNLIQFLRAEHERFNLLTVNRIANSFVNYC